MTDLYPKDQINHIISEMNSRQMYDLSGENRFQLFHVSVPGNVINNEKDVQTMLSALPKVKFIATDAYVGDLQWGKFVAIRIVRYQWSNENHTHDEDVLMEKLFRDGNLHVSLVRFLSNNDRENINNSNTVTVKREAREIAEEIVQESLKMKGNTLSKKATELWKKYLDKTNLRMDFLHHQYELNRVHSFRSLINKIKGDVNAQQDLINVIAGGIPNEEVISNFSQTKYIYNTFSHKYVSGVENIIQNSSEHQLVLQPETLTNNTRM